MVAAVIVHLSSDSGHNPSFMEVELKDEHNVYHKVTKFTYMEPRSLVIDLAMGRTYADLLRKKSNFIRKICEKLHLKVILNNDNQTNCDESHYRHHF